MIEKQKTSHKSRKPVNNGSIRKIFSYRELLFNLTRTELQLRYKNSVLGFIWSLLNPLLYLVVFSLVFQEILRTNIPMFAIFLLSGLLIWNFFSSSLNSGTGAIIGNASIVKKIWFPREVLPLASVGASAIHFFLQAFVLVLALLVFQHEPNWAALSLLPLALLVIIVLASAGAITLSALNVYYRDIQHFLEISLIAWFWLTPIVYNYNLVADRLGNSDWIAMLNPITPVVLTFQKALHNPPAGYLPDVSLWQYFQNLGIVLFIGLILLSGSLRLFHRLDSQLADKI
ncbi:MAG: ABC transporter permease [Acidimicrobiales bacterium]|mgnify:FL=1|nr:ABC transporter permease [Acidimicrobiaceae bacterium]|tara:strand:- start:1758 stop:2618 length:861 start_codon:yes stop_codon:yes gene_type:complete